MTTNAKKIYYDADCFLALHNAEFLSGVNAVGVPNSEGMIETHFTATMDSISVMRNMGIWHIKNDPLGRKGIFGCMENGKEVAERILHVTRIKKRRTPPLTSEAADETPTPTCARRTLLL